MPIYPAWNVSLHVCLSILIIGASLSETHTYRTAVQNPLYISIRMSDGKRREYIYTTIDTILHYLWCNSVWVNSLYDHNRFFSDLNTSGSCCVASCYPVWKEACNFSSVMKLIEKDWGSCWYLDHVWTLRVVGTNSMCWEPFNCTKYFQLDIDNSIPLTQNMYTRILR